MILALTFLHFQLESSLDNQRNHCYHWQLQNVPKSIPCQPGQRTPPVIFQATNLNFWLWHWYDKRRARPDRPGWW